MPNRLLRVYEHQTLFFDEPADLVQPEGQRLEWTNRHREVLRAFHTRSKGLYYSLINGGIKFKQYVGALQVLDVTIEILPKIERQREGALPMQAWHGVLLDMLKVCKLLRPRAEQTADLKLRPNSILEIYIGLYVGELEGLLRRGLIKKYRKVAGNELALKGAIDFSKQLSLNAVHGERFYTRHFTYDRQHALHQVLLQGLVVCEQLVHQGPLRDRIKRLFAEWPGSMPLRITENSFEQFRFDRRTGNYQEAIGIARLLLLNYHPDIQAGRSPVLALLFDMNRLWEEYVFRQLSALQDTFGFKLYGQTMVALWREENNEVAKNIRPDLLLEYGAGTDGKRVIIDTKWKVPDDDRPADADLKQMLIYKFYYHADEALLLYPTLDASKLLRGVFENEVHFTAAAAGRLVLNAGLDPDCHSGFLNLLTIDGRLKDTGQLAAELKYLGFA